MADANAAAGAAQDVDAAPERPTTSGSRGQHSLTKMPSSSGLGKSVRMRALPVSEIPLHPALAHQKNPPALEIFVNDILAEAEAFMTDFLPREFVVKKKSQSSAPSAASVELMTKDISEADLPKELLLSGKGIAGENWFARTSIHENAAKQGTASWEEFDDGLRVDHSVHEMEYTPNVFDAHEVLDWNLEREKKSTGDWHDLDMRVMEMVHKVPPPLNNRVFPVLVLSGRKISSSSFTVVQIPVDTTSMPDTKYSSGRELKTTTGMYCSIERCEVIEDGAKVKWQMATASNAKGNVPMWAQKMGVPGAVIKDVGLFIGWCAKRRN